MMKTYPRLLKLFSTTQIHLTEGKFAKAIFLSAGLSLFAVDSFSQATLPAISSLPFSFTTYTGTVFPSFLTVGKSGGTGLSTADFNTDAANGSSGAQWRAEGSNGISYQGGSGSTTPIGCFQIRVNATGATAIQVSWRGRTITDNSSILTFSNIDLQWRNGAAGAWNTVSGFTYPSILGNATFNATLPAGANNLADLRIRWVTSDGSYLGFGTARDRVGVDDISICGTPTVAAGNSGAACSGSSITLTGSPSGLSYQWTGPAGFSSTLQNPTVSNLTPLKTGSYFLTVTSGGCSATGSTVVSDFGTTTPIPSASPSAVCPGDPVTLSVNSSLRFNNNMAMDIPNGSGGGVFSPVVVSGFSPASVSSGTLVSVTFSIDHPFTNDLEIHLVAPNGMDIILADNVGLGADFTNTTVVSSGAPNGNFSPLGNPFNGTYNSATSFSALNGSAANGTWNLRVIDGSILFTGDLIKWTLNLESNGLTYSWSSSPAGFSAAVPNPVANPVVNTLYTVSASANGCTYTSITPAAVEMQTPQPTVSSNSPVCFGDSIRLFGNNITPGQTSGNSYSWSGPDGFTSSEQNPELLATPASAGVYTLTVTNSLSCTEVTTHSISLNALPAVSATSNAPFCSATQNLALGSNAPTGQNYSWTGPGGFTSQDANPTFINATETQNGIYKVVVTDANGCRDSSETNVTVWALPPVDVIVIGNTHLCTGQTTSDLQAVGAHNYSWSTTETSELITVATAGTYEVTGTDLNGCVNTDEIVMTESVPPAAPSIVALGDVQLCSNDGGSTFNGVLLHTTNYSSGLTWSSSETSQDIFVDYLDNFNVTYTDVVGCYAVSNLISTIPAFASTAPVDLQVSSDVPDNAICDGPVTLTLAEADGTDPLADAYLGTNAQWVWYDETGCGSNSIGTGASINITPSAIPGPHTYYVRAEGYCNTTSCASIVITVKDSSVAPSSASASVADVCAGDQTNLSVSGGYLGTGAQWKWYSGSCNGTLVGIGPGINVNPTATSNYYVRAEGDCNITTCESTTVTVKTLSTDPASASSNAPVNGICIGGSVTLSVAGGALGDNSDWVWYEDGCGNGAPVGTGSSVIITPSYEGLHSYYVRAEGPCNTTNCVGVSVLVGTPSVEASSVSSSIAGNSICTGNNIMLSVNGGFLGTVAQWQWYSGSCGGTAAGTGTSITVNPLVSTTYYVRAEGSCNNTICANIVVNVSNLPPTGSPPTITSAPNGICNGNAGTVTANPVAGATFYSWSAPSGTTFDGGNPSPYITTSNSVQVTFGNLPIGVSGYDICVFAGNGCGNSVTKCRYIRGRVQTAQTISGNASSCPNTSSLYSIVSLPGADSYTWTVTGAATINGGGTTLTTNSTSVTVNFLAGWTSGTLSVYGSMNCGYNGPAKTITIISTPVVPGIMTGPTLVCPLGTYSYSIAPVAGALSYNWSTSVPGAVIGAGSTSINITFPSVIPAGSTVSVTATGSCGTSLPRVKNIATGLANTPGTIQGPAMGQCGQTGVAYSILPVAGATSYFWSATNGAVINGPNNANVASVDFPVLFSTSNVSVVAVNGCGNSAPQTKLVSGAPGSPGAITGSNSVCIGTIQSYSVVGSAGATAYVWSSPVGSTIVGGQNSPTVQVYFDAVTSGTVSVYASNSCGSSSTVNFGVSVVCRLAQVSQGSLLDAMLYPNPTIGTTTLKFETATAGDYQVSVVDVTGRVMQSMMMSAVEGENMQEIDLSTYAKGLYMIRMERAGEPIQLLRVTVQ